MLRIAQKNTKRSFALGLVGVLWTESRVCRSLLPARQRAYTSLEKRALWWQTAQAARQVHASHEPFPPIFYCIHIDTVTGHHAVPDPVESARPVIRIVD